MKHKRRIMAVSLGVIVLLLMACISGGFYMLDYALRPIAIEKDYRASDLSGSWRYMFDKYPEIEPWVDSLRQVAALKDTFVVASDGVRLHAFYVTSPDTIRQTAVIVHGYTDNAVRMLMIGYLYYHNLHYNILLPDLRYAGQSGGTHIQMGWNDRLDVLRWMEIANELFGGDTQMVVHGISMGAATTMMLSGEPQQEYVKCFVEDCGYTSVWDQFSKELDEQFHLPEFPLLYMANVLCRLRYGWDFQEASALEQVKKCSLPMLFIHGDADDYVPTWMVYRLYEVKPEPKELWIVPQAAHAASYHDYRAAYTRRIQEFTAKYMK